MKTCAICRKNKTGRLIKGIPVCGECFLEGQYNLPENQELLRERLRARGEAEKAAKAGKPKVASQPKQPADQPESKPEEQSDRGIVGNYLCPKCQVTHKFGSKIHKRHLKLLEAK